MRDPAGREPARSDILLPLGCVLLALIALAMPRDWAKGFAEALRATALRPLVALQARAARDRISRFELVSIQRHYDSLAILVQGTEPLRRENDNLRAMLGVRPHLPGTSVGAEVLHRPGPTDSRMLLIGVGTADGVKRYDPVVSGDGLIGFVWNAGPTSSSVRTWADPDFGASAVTVDGRVRGLIRPSAAGMASLTVLELHGVALRDSLPLGTAVMTAGDGGTYPRGLPIGRVISVGKEELGFERIYRVMPFSNPGDATHVLVLVTRDSAAVAPPVAKVPTP